MEFGEAIQIFPPEKKNGKWTLRCMDQDHLQLSQAEFEKILESNRLANICGQLRHDERKICWVNGLPKFPSGKREQERLLGEFVVGIIIDDETAVFPYKRDVKGKVQFDIKLLSYM